MGYTVIHTSHKSLSALLLKGSNGSNCADIRLVVAVGAQRCCVSSQGSRKCECVSFWFGWRKMVAQLFVIPNCYFVRFVIGWWEIGGAEEGVRVRSWKGRRLRGAGGEVWLPTSSSDRPAARFPDTRKGQLASYLQRLAYVYGASKPYSDATRTLQLRASPCLQMAVV